MKKWGLGLMALLMMLQTVPASAAGKEAVILKGKQEGEEKIQLQCYTEMGKEITNGKLRLLYDEEKVKLVSSAEGDALEGGMCEINDCLTGNKKEGELVAAFASSGTLKEKGNYKEEMDLSDLAKNFSFNYSYLSTYFNTRMGEGFSEYLNRIRIHHACLYLEKHEMPISSVSEMVGYSDQSYFCRVFKKITGETPSAYRRRHKSGRK